MSAPEGLTCAVSVGVCEFLCAPNPGTAGLRCRDTLQQLWLGSDQRAPPRPADSLHGQIDILLRWRVGQLHAMQCFTVLAAMPSSPGQDMQYCACNGYMMPGHATLARLPVGLRDVLKQNFQRANSSSDTPSSACTLGLNSDRVSPSEMRMKRGSPKVWGCSMTRHPN